MLKLLQRVTQAPRVQTLVYAPLHRPVQTREHLLDTYHRVCDELACASVHLGFEDPHTCYLKGLAQRLYYRLNEF